MQLLVYAFVEYWIVSNVLNMTNNAIGLLETTYSRVSFRPHNHYDCCTILAENSPSEFEYTVLQNIMT